MDNDIDTDTDDDPNPDPGDNDNDSDNDDDNISRDDAVKKAMSERKEVAEIIPSIDKRQYMRFNASKEPITMEENVKINSIVDISRGGMALSHNKQVKVGDVIPVHFKYGNMDIQADVKITSASDVRAGAEFINLNEATANKLLYMNLLMEGNNKTISKN